MNCEMYLQELDQIPSTTIRKTSSSLWMMEGKRKHLEIYGSNHFFLISAALV